MDRITTIDAVRAWSRDRRRQGRTVGLVPTMGYLHDGHLSLVREAAERCSRVVVSVFVNPTQFGPSEDFAGYPRDLERDAALVEGAGADALFHPPTEEMYPDGAERHRAWVEVDTLDRLMCGTGRPGHFRGVCTVVSKLFAAVEPDRAFFGQKDAQQYFILRRMARDLNLGVEVLSCPTVRESDGLAMSSRNVYLEKEERRAAPVLYRALERAREVVSRGERDAAVVESELRGVLAREPLAQVEYVEIVDTGHLQPVERIDGSTLIALAARFGRARLIDNVIIEEEPSHAP